jgi:hypothetical protein
MAAAMHIGVYEEIAPFSRISGKLQQIGREVSQDKKNVTRFDPPARLRQASNFGL